MLYLYNISLLACDLLYSITEQKTNTITIKLEDAMSKEIRDKRDKDRDKNLLFA